jgi:hypothetical protein
LGRGGLRIFDFRYHVASLAAVFVALIIGILVGVAVSGSGFVEGRERDLLNGQIAGLRADLDRARERQGELEDAQRSGQAFVDRAYDAVMAGRLEGRGVAILFIGRVDRDVLGPVDQAISTAGGDRIRYRSLEVPIDSRLEEIESELGSRAALAGYSGEDNLGDLGHDLAREFVTGGQTPLWDVLSDELVQERNGGAERAADAVVVVRSVEAQGGPTAQFLHGLYTGLRGSVPAVGVELAATQESAIDAYRRERLSSVDAVDTRVGRVALVVLLAGGPEGHYGIKATADAVLPPVDPATPPAAGE